MVDQVQSLRSKGVQSSVIASKSGVENLLAILPEGPPKGYASLLQTSPPLYVKTCNF